MRRQDVLKRIILVLTVIGFLGASYIQVRAQENIVSYLDGRFKQQNLPITSIKITRELPLQIEIVIQSTSDGSRGNPEDPINYHLVEREVVLARQQGYYVESLTRIVVSPLGKEIARSTIHVKLLEFMFLDDSPARISDSAAKNIIVEEINLYNMSATDIKITSQKGLQNLSLQLSTPSLEEVNKNLPQFMPSLRGFVSNTNARGAHIVICKLEIRDQKGILLLNYLLDLQLDAEKWWMADGLTMDWFPHPGPGPAPQ